MYNLIHPLATWHQFQQNPVHESFLESLKAFFSYWLPELLGLRQGRANHYLIPYFSSAAYGILLASFIYLIVIRLQGGFQGSREDRGSDRGLGLLLIFIFFYPLIFSLSGFSAKHTSRYLVPLYPALLLVWAALFFHLRKRTPWLAWFFVALIGLTNGYGLYRMCLVFHPQEVREYRHRKMGHQALFASLQSLGLREVYVRDYWRSVPLTFDAGEKIIFAQPYHDRFPFFTRLADRSPRPAFLSTDREGVFEKTLQAMGGSYKKEGRWLFYDFEAPPLDFVELSAAGWQAGPDGPNAPGSLAFDRDLGTRWNPGSSMKPGQVFHLDLGKAVPDVSRVVLFSGSPEWIPRGLRLDLSPDGRNYKTLAEIPYYWGSLFWSGPRPFARYEKGITELGFTPQAGRFLKITQTGTDSENRWNIAEILVYRGLPRVSKDPREGIPSLSGLKERLRALSVERVLAGPWIESHLAPVRPEKHERPAARLPETVGGRLPPYSFPAIIAVSEQSGLLKEALNEAAPGVYTEERIDPYVLYVVPGFQEGYRKLSSTGWRASSNVNGGEAYRAIDGKINSRWTSGRPQVPGVFFRVDLGRAEKISRLRLRLGDSSRDFPRRMEVRFSIDGLRWGKAAPLNIPIYWTGEKLFKDDSSGETDLVFRETPARFVEILQTGQDPVHYWSIHELELFTPE